MLRKYALTMYRSFVRQKGYTLINLLGLAAALVCCLFIFLYIGDEYSYDRFHERADRIYRVATDLQRPAGTSETAFTAARWGPLMQDTYPEVQQATRLMHYRSDVLVRNETNRTRFYEPRFLWADSTVFDLFTLTFLAGHAETALSAPNSLVLSESMADKYFGTTDVIGQTLTVEWGGPRSFTVTGVMEDMPATSHFKADFLGTFLTIEETWASTVEGGNLYFYTYVLLPEQYDAFQLQAKLPNLVTDVLGAETAETYRLALQPLTRIHLHSQRNNEIQPTNDIAYLYLLGTIGIFILLVACINFINLTTAKSAQRIKEVGIRKTLGGQRWQLAAQFLAESLLIAFLAVLVAALFTQSLLPLFNQLAGKELVLDAAVWGMLALPLLALVLIVGVLAGSYPAFYLSGFHPSEALRGRSPAQASSGGGLRKGLVVFQFTVTAMLICCTLIASNQGQHLREHRLGFDKEQLLSVPLRSASLVQAQTYLKDVLQRTPGISDVTLSSHQTGGQVYRSGYGFEGIEEPIVMDRLHTDHSFTHTYGIDLVAGRGFSEDFALDTTAFLIN